MNQQLTFDVDGRPAAVSTLSAHPVVIEVVRIASRLTEGAVEVVVFDGGHALVVGSLGRVLLQPRRLTRSESALISGTGRHASGSDGTSAAVVDPDGRTVGALTVAPASHTLDPETLLALGRLCSAALAAAGPGVDTATAVLENLRDAVVVVDTTMTISYANRATTIQLGRGPSELIGSQIGDLVHPDDLDDALDALLRLGSGSEVYRTVVRVLHGSGDYMRLEVTGKDMTTDPQLAGFVLSLRNGDHDLELESTLDQTRHLTNELVEQLHDGIIATDAVGSFLVVNRAAQEILGLPVDTPPASISIDAIEFFDAAAMPIARHDHPIRRALAGECIARQLMSVVIDGRVRNVMVSGRPVRNDSGEQIGAAIGFHDVTEARRVERQLTYGALHDELTGLPNRRQLKERVAHVLASLDNGDRRAASLHLVDLDGFKLVNDTYGQRVGDQVIRAVGARLAGSQSNDDLVVRIGGDAFVVLSRGATVDGALAAAHHRRRSLADPIDIDGHRITLSCSTGVAHLEADDLRDDLLLRQAEIALSEAKGRGGNRVELFDARMAMAVETSARQREFLRQALEERSLEMHFQPLVDADSGEIVGFESLARCRTTDGELVGPAGFVAAASRSGLVWDLDRRAFDLSCRAAARIASRVPGLRMSCNFSALSVTQPDFERYVIETAARHGVATAQLCVEITESAAFEAGQIFHDALRSVHATGINVALDDFGTGYSSLSHLRNLPLEVVKVDRSFIAKVGTHSAERSIVEAIVNLARGLDLDVIAEGVETRQQLDAAQAIGFSVIQGHYYSPARELDEILAAFDSSPGASPVVPAEWRVARA